MEENFNIHLGKKLECEDYLLDLPKLKLSNINVFSTNSNMKRVRMGLVQWLINITVFKSSIIYFFEDYKEFKDVSSGEETNDDLNYSF